ncbi:Uncharacterised protein [Chryseobacterium indologenes]|nr:Uncharacterised protein [Chryseobacterium indologenes]
MRKQLLKPVNFSVFNPFYTFPLPENIVLKYRGNTVSETKMAIPEIRKIHIKPILIHNIIILKNSPTHSQR